MSVTLQIQPLSCPVGQEFPATVQELEDLLAQYLLIIGGDRLTGIAIGPSTPAAKDRGKPWLKTGATFRETQWYKWNGAEWVPMPAVTRSGTLAAAPTGTQEGQLYYATDGAGLCAWTGSAWVTADGVSGEVRQVEGTDITAILARYPGWTQVTDCVGTVLGVAGTGSAYGFSDRVAESHTGAETHTNTLGEMFNHDHGGPVRVDASSKATGDGTLLVMSGVVATSSVEMDGGPTAQGGNAPWSILNPTKYLFTIQKT